MSPDKLQPPPGSGAGLTFDPETHIYRLDGFIVPSVTAVIRAAGLEGDTSHYTAESAWRGTVVHAVSQLIDEDDMDWKTLDPDMEGYARAFEKFRKESDWLPWLIEKPLCSRINRYAGTLDRYGVLNGKTALIDIKSGGYQRWHDIQLGGYEDLLLCNRAALKIEPPEIRLTLQLMRTGDYKIHTPKIDHNRARNLFLSALNIARWKGVIE